jgi:hypothetical protein
MSAALHFLLALALALVTPAAPRGEVAEPDRPASIAIVRQQLGRQTYFNEQGSIGSSSAAAPSPFGSSLAGALPTGDAAAPALSSLLPTDDMRGASGLEMGELLPAIEAPAGFDRAKIRGEKGRTEVFGLEGEGSTFIYVFDRSGSMGDYEGRPLVAAKRELTRSLEDLDTIHQFQIIFYNESVSLCAPLGEARPRLLYGVERDKEAAAAFVRRVVADGGTDHMPALQAALRMGPDVIFFLTDADEPRLSPSQLDRLRQMNAGVGAVIHTIEFGVGSDRGQDNFIRRLALQNGGRHVYVDVTALP